MQLHDIVPRIDDAIDQRGERLEGLLFLRVEFVAIIHGAHSADHMPKTPLGMVTRNAGPTHERARGPAQIVQRPVRYAARLIEPALELGETA